ncbi:MAG TPA: hypothetical protein VEG61_02870 [Candidatus Dormibacteraeota bacterium]|nr:hypothetical protein [Candidatus Dormibacteraeota bacterium]
MLGEVDTGFVIWYRARKYKVKVSEMFDQALENYVRFLSGISKKGKRIIVINTPLLRSKMTMLRDVANCTQKERTQLTLRFNNRV